MRLLKLLTLAVFQIAWRLLEARAGDFSVVHNFGVLTNGTGVNPVAPLVQAADGMLYGTMASGGSGSVGTVFKVATNGTGFTVLHGFSGSDGGYPEAGLVLSGSILYGTTSYGSSGGNGTVFRVNADGTGFTNLYSFSALVAGVNNDGAHPVASLVLSGSMLYGATFDGGSLGFGTLFKLGTNGTGFVPFYSFTDGSDGAHPAATLIVSGTTLYGTTESGGDGFFGTVFSVNTDGSGMFPICSFSSGFNGADPKKAGVVLSGSTLYGTTSGDGSAGFGTVFKVNVNGSGFTNIYAFSGGSDGANPSAGLILSGSLLYGTTVFGGSGGNGTVFELATNGTGFVALHGFTTLAATGTNTDGAGPYAGLLLSSNMLYGMTQMGGSFLGGTLFKLNSSGSGFTNLFDFAGGSDGAYPRAGVALAGSVLYGTAYGGGSGASGALFKVNTDGSSYSVVHSFSPLAESSSPANRDGATPYGNVIAVGGTLFGTAYEGGSAGNGTVFQVTTNGTGFTTLCSFTNVSDGFDPVGGVILSGSTLYGTTYYGGSNAVGTVFRINTNGTGYARLYSFTGLLPTLVASNSDGAYPTAELVESGSQLFGTAFNGGLGGAGSVFRLNTDGSGFTNLHSFTQLSMLDSGTNNDGAYPQAGLVVAGSTLYGTAADGGYYGNGTIFTVGTNGAGFKVLYHFTGGSDGANPKGQLVLSSNLLYGTTEFGGGGGAGTLFQISLTGTNFNSLYSFSALSASGTNNGGANPLSGVVLSSKVLYGTTSAGGSLGQGTVYALSLRPVLQIRLLPTHTAAVLSWNDPTFTLQSSALVTGSYSQVSGASSPYTNAISGTQKYFRLKGN